MYIILEYLLIENFIINLLIFYITGIITKTKIKKTNIILGAFVGSLYSLVFFSEILFFLSKFYMKFIISLLLVKISFNAKSTKLYLSQVLAFYIVSFIFAGATIGLFYSSNDLVELFYKPIIDFGGFPVIYLILGILLSTIVSRIIFTYHNKKQLREKYLINIKIHYKEKLALITTLLDTGNSLIEPFSKSPVILIEYEKIKHLLPPVMDKLFRADGLYDFSLLENILKSVENEIAISLIPFKSVGASNGLLLGFKPDYIIIDYNTEKSIIRKDMIIGIYKGVLSLDDSYNGLLNYEMISQEA